MIFACLFKTLRFLFQAFQYILNLCFAFVNHVHNILLLESKLIDQNLIRITTTGHSFVIYFVLHD